MIFSICAAVFSNNHNEGKVPLCNSVNKLRRSNDTLHTQPIFSNPHKSRAEDKYGRATKLNGT